MTSKEYVIWLQGFVEACNDYAPTPKQWDTLKDKLAEVGEPISFPFGTPNTAPNTHSFPTWQHPHYIDPYKITCQPGTTITTTPGSGSITIANPYLVSFTTGSATYPYNPSTTTIWNPSGSNWSYTTTLPKQPTTGSNQLELDFEPKDKWEPIVN